MTASLLSTAVDGTLAAVGRLRGLWFTLTQTSVAAGLAWLIAHDLLKHPQPFFAPVAAAVCLSASNVLRGIRAIQMMIGVALGIGIGALVQGPLGTGSVAVGVAVFIALSTAVSIGHGFIAQGLMFVNQTAVSAILVLALPHNGIVGERLFDSLIGGSLALVFSILLFPANPFAVLHSARDSVLAGLHDVLARTAQIADGATTAPRDWPSSAIDRVHEQLGGLIQARTTARQVVRVAPRRWSARRTFSAADQQAARVAMFAVSVVHLARAVGPALDACGSLPRPVHAALTELVAGTQVADSDPATAAAHAARARSHADEFASIARRRTEVLLADAVAACVDDMHRVVVMGDQAARPASG
ncbi:aromatic acid exporter family protein [Mycobacterium kubicae]|uniref:FUSC family protein n=1 Tax=Mycobacterium kubicae TaxID=120959 RepID=UPI00163EF8EA|nr:FUSC family protein [Mycobacterium kubicae]QNI06612.1 aromatic acid exporter family protein [Mycobacterium kubicae]